MQPSVHRASLRCSGTAGEYNPVEISPCTKECGACLTVCPFTDSGENEDTIGNRLYGEIPEIQHRPETGYYLASYVGYSEKHRKTSASGGIATWLLEKMLAEDIIDHVICVTPTGNPEKLFSFRIFNTPEGIRTGAGSAYYPVEMSGVIKQVIEVPGRYAITGLPCFLKAVRLAQQRNAKLKERIAITVGLVCGQMKSKHFTDYIASVVGAQGNVIGVRYRGKSLDHPATNFHFAFTTDDGEVKKISRKEGISEAWTNRWFTPNACNYCDDIFAECADVTCMDAWLPEYAKDGRGTSLMLVRSPLVEKAIARGQGAQLEPISVNRLVRSQAGVVAVKRQHLRYRMYLDQGRRQKVLTRIRPEKPRNLFLRREIVLKDEMRIISKDLWADNMTDTKSFRKAMRPVLTQLAIQNTIMLPVRVAHHLLMTIKATY